MLALERDAQVQTLGQVPGQDQASRSCSTAQNRLHCRPCVLKLSSVYCSDVQGQVLRGRREMAPCWGMDGLRRVASDELPQLVAWRARGPSLARIAVCMHGLC